MLVGQVSKSVGMHGGVVWGQVSSSVGMQGIALRCGSMAVLRCGQNIKRGTFEFRAVEPDDVTSAVIWYEDQLHPSVGRRPHRHECVGKGGIQNKGEALLWFSYRVTQPSKGRQSITGITFPRQQHAS